MSSPSVVSFDEYIVFGASDPAVTRRACPNRHLLAVQQVTTTRYLAKRDKTKTIFTAYCMPLDARLTATRVALYFRIYRMSFRLRSGTEVNTPRSITSRSILAHHNSTWLSQDE
jgi:hypothetical protein